MRASAFLHIPHLAFGGLVMLLGPALAGAAGSTATADTMRGAHELRRAAEAAMGAPVALDPRLPVPACPTGYRFAPLGAGRSVDISCPATGWRTVAPLAAAASGVVATAGVAPAAVGQRTAALVRRGDMVTVTHELPGFVLTVEAVAEGSGGAGDRILLRNRVTGARFPATIGADGAVTVSR